MLLNVIFVERFSIFRRFSIWKVTLLCPIFRGPDFPRRIAIRVHRNECCRDWWKWRRKERSANMSGLCACFSRPLSSSAFRASFNQLHVTWILSWMPCLLCPLFQAAVSARTGREPWAVQWWNTTISWDSGWSHRHRWNVAFRVLSKMLGNLRNFNFMKTRALAAQRWLNWT